MNETVFIGVVGTLAAVAGAVLTYLGMLKGIRSNESIDDRTALRTFQTTELKYCREELNKWRTLALNNLGGMEEAVEVIEQQNTTGGSS